MKSPYCEVTKALQTIIIGQKTQANIGMFFLKVEIQFEIISSVMTMVSLKKTDKFFSLEISISIFVLMLTIKQFQAK